MRTYANGLNFMGQLGQGHFKQNAQTFQSIAVLEGIKVKQLGAHMTQSYALLNDNQILNWGWIMDTLTQARTLSFYKRFPTFCSLWQKFSFIGDTMGMRGGNNLPILINKNMLGQQIQSISIGGCFVTALMGDGSVYGMGENYKGQLGMGDAKFKPQFTRIPIPTQERIVQTASGYQHNMLLTESGRVYASGRCNHYQYYKTNAKSQVYVDFRPSLSMMELQNDTISKISAGFHHSLFLSSKQKLYACGINVYGQCGVANLEEQQIKQLTPVYIELRQNETVEQMVSGKSHNLLLTNQNRLLFFGSCLHNQMGYKPKFDFEQSGPTELHLPLEENETITRIVANFDQSAAFTSKQDCIIWGGQDLTKYHIPSYPTYTRLKSIIGDQNISIKDVGLGFTHTLVYVE